MANGGPFRKVVAAYDGSKDSAKAVEVAASLARKLGSELVVVHVYNSPLVAYSAISTMPVPNYSGLEAAAKEGAQMVLTRGVMLAKAAGARAKGELLEAPSTVQALVEFSANEKADLIVVGTKGMSGFKKLLIGSVSSGVVNHARCPVLVVR
jgi:nucleotide-binding universal stress UspA family protein